jgi:hypothetical protein
MKRTIGVLAWAAVVAMLAAPAGAHPVRASGSTQTSVFPIPRDPWKSWGMRPGQQQLGAPRHDGLQGQPPHNGVWNPGRWVWDGAAWVWWPGHWSAR